MVQDTERTRGRGYHFRMVELRPVTDANRSELEALRVSTDQERFVSSVRDSLVEAAEEPGARAIAWGVYDADTPVGFVMIADEVDDPGYKPQYLWKLLIDERYQRRGFGTATLDLVVAYFRARQGVTVTWTSAGEGEGGPIPFYPGSFERGRCSRARCCFASTSSDAAPALRLRVEGRYATHRAHPARPLRPLRASLRPPAGCATTRSVRSDRPRRRPVPTIAWTSA